MKITIDIYVKDSVAQDVETSCKAICIGPICRTDEGIREGIDSRGEWIDHIQIVGVDFEDEAKP